MTVLEGTDFIVDNLEEDPIAFPFPAFQWMRNGLPVTNITGIVAYGYPSVSFYNISRKETGTYLLFAENFAINSTSVAVGNDTGSLVINVLCECIHSSTINLITDGPELDEPVTDIFATVQEESVTVVCGTNLASSPPPIVQWFSDTDSEISPSDERFSMSNGPDVVSLTIFNTTRNDNGTWNCVLTLNSPNGTVIGRLERNVTVFILGEFNFMYILYPL